MRNFVARLAVLIVAGAVADLGCDSHPRCGRHHQGAARRIRGRDQGAAHHAAGLQSAPAEARRAADQPELADTGRPGRLFAHDPAARGRHDHRQYSQGEEAAARQCRCCDGQTNHPPADRRRQRERSKLRRQLHRSAFCSAAGRNNSGQGRERRCRRPSACGKKTAPSR